VARFSIAALGFAALWLVVAFGAQAAGSALLNGDDNVLALECGRRLPVTAPAPATPLVPVEVLLVIDDEWQEHFGSDAEREARLVATRAASHYRNLGIHVLPTRVVTWESPDSAATLTELLDRADAADLLDGEDVALIFTAQHVDGSEDGDASVGGQFAIVRHHTDHGARDEFVLAHEIGHVFGAHHGCDVSGLAGLMADRGIEQPARLCPCTRRAIENNVARFHDT
jgi:hypothetical protein